MATKAQFYSELTERSMKNLTNSRENWTEYLSASARHYKYTFDEQVMIYTQRPEATACAPIETWNDPMNRHVKRGSKGIALIYQMDGKPRLRYVFDYADTESGWRGREGINPFIWELKKEHERAVSDALVNAYGGNEGSLADMLYNIASELAAGYYSDNARDIAYSVSDSFLDGFGGDNVSSAFREALTISAAYSLISRCGLDPDGYFEDEDFSRILDFNTHDTVNALGTAVSELSGQVLREIEVTIKKYERANYAERGRKSDAINIHQDRGLYASRPDGAGANGNADREIRDDEAGIHSEQAEDILQFSASEGQADGAPVGYRPESGNAADAVDGGNGSTEPAPGQSIKPDGMDAPHEQSENASGGNGTERTDLQLENQTAGAADDTAPVSVRNAELAEPAEDKSVDTRGYRYYSVRRPVDIGTYPRASTLQNIVNFDRRQPVEDGAFQAWGYLVYGQPLTDAQISEYELRAAPGNPVAETKAEEVIENGSQVGVNSSNAQETRPSAEALEQTEVTTLENAAPSDITRRRNAFGEPIVESAVQISLDSLPTYDEQVITTEKAGKAEDDADAKREITAFSAPIIEQADIDAAVRAWNGDTDSKIRVYEYMWESAHARARETAELLKQEYGGNLPALTVTKDGAQEVILPWAKVQKRIAQLMDGKQFLTTEEQNRADGELTGTWRRLAEKNNPKAPKQTAEPSASENPPAPEETAQSQYKYDKGDTVYLPDGTKMTIFNIQYAGELVFISPPEEYELVLHPWLVRQFSRKLFLELLASTPLNDGLKIENPSSPERITPEILISEALNTRSTEEYGNRALAGLLLQDLRAIRLDPIDFFNRHNAKDYDIEKAAEIRGYLSRALESDWRALPESERLPVPFPITSREWENADKSDKLESPYENGLALMRNHYAEFLPVVIDDENGHELTRYYFQTPDSPGAVYSVNAYSENEAARLIDREHYTITAALPLRERQGKGYETWLDVRGVYNYRKPLHLALNALLEREIINPVPTYFNHKDNISNLFNDGNTNARIETYLSKVFQEADGTVKSEDGAEISYSASVTGLRIADEGGSNEDYSWEDIATVCRMLFNERRVGFRALAERTAEREGKSVQDLRDERGTVTQTAPETVSADIIASEISGGYTSAAGFTDSAETQDAQVAPVGIPVNKAIIDSFSEMPNIHYAPDTDGGLFVSNGYYVTKTDERDINNITSRINARRRKNEITPVLTESLPQRLNEVKGTYELSEAPYELKIKNHTALVFSDGKQYFQYNKRFADIFKNSGAHAFVDDNSGYDVNNHMMVFKAGDGKVLGVVLPIAVPEELYEDLSGVLPLEIPRKSAVERIKENPANDPYIGREFYDGRDNYIISEVTRRGGVDMYLVPTVEDGKVSRSAMMIPFIQIEENIARWEANRVYAEQQKAADEIKAQKEAAEKAVYEDTRGYADKLPPMQKANVLRVLNDSFATKDYGILNVKQFMEAAIKDGKTLATNKSLKKKFYDMHAAEYLRGISEKQSMEAWRIYHAAYSKPTPEDSPNAVWLKENHPFLYYKLYHDTSVLDESYLSTEYRVMLEENTFFTITKTAYDYGSYLINNAILERERESEPVADTAHEYVIGEIVYLENDREFVIERIDGDEITLTDNSLAIPVKRSLGISVFAELLRENPRNSRPDEILETPDNTEAAQRPDGAETDNSTEPIPGPAPSLENAPNPSILIASYVKSKLEAGEKISSAELFAEAAKAYGDTMANNAFTSKDAYDAMELGVNQYILSADNISLGSVLSVLDLLPTQTRRTAEMERFQQFSTPPSIAYLANWAANVGADDIMLEPSAGNGGIAVFAKKDGAAVYVNELDKRRLEIIKNLPFDGFYNEDAEQINNIIGDKITPTLIVMNPPFSSSPERNMQGTKIGAKHIEEALKILAPNGRLAAVVGQGMEDGAPAFRNWWREIKEQYNVKANIGIDGKNYSKYGTTFGIQLLVIDKDGPTIAPVKTGFVENLSDVQSILEGIRNDRPSVRIEHDNGNEQRPVTAARTDAVTEREADREPNDPVSDTGGGTDTASDGDRREPSGTSEISASAGGITGVTHGHANINDDGSAPIVEAERQGGNDGRNNGDNGAERTGAAVSGQSAGSVKPVARPPKPIKKELTDSIFERYEPQTLLIENAQPHPATISESAAMSAIEPPPVTYKPILSQSLIDDGVLSDVQLEAVTYAGQSHSQTLPNGNTRGFFLGDGTGVGKGRTVTGIILDNYAQGRKKAVWLSENRGLIPDAKRDVAALFGNSDLVKEFEGGKKADSSLSIEEGILFTTYSSLSKGYDQSGSNYEKIVKWLGEDFDGVIVFDEAHNMANSIATKGGRGVKKASQRGMAGLAIQEALPKAKIVYSSATGATEVENLRYAERLGLWGEGTAFPNGDDFVHKVKAGGLAAMELIARDMKAMGVYLSRNISYEDVVYEKIVHELTPDQRVIYDELARSWQIVLQNINKALETTNQNKDGSAKGKAYGAFWSAEQRFFNQILTAMQVPSMLTDIQKQLDDNNSVVIQLVSTNESAQEREFARLQEQELDLDDFDLTPKQMLMSYIENSFPTVQFEEYQDENGNVKSKPVYDSQGKAVINREAVRQKEMLLDKLGSIKVPASPLDMIINHFGSDMVAENTGRKRRVVIKDGKAKEENIANKKQADVTAFQNGDKRIIIFSKAGGTGKSYHADKSAKNHQHRVHYLLQAGWQADAAVQGFGRSHRSNQVSAPTFVLVTTDLKGQMRFISTIAKRLDQLGALTKGQRQTGSQGLFTAGDNLENSFAADVLTMFYKILLQNGISGIPDGLSIIEKLGLKDRLMDEYGNINIAAAELREVNKFLNRILSLECYEQNAVFEGYAERLYMATEKAMREGTLDKGLENLKADKIVLKESHDIRVDDNTGATTKYYSLTAHDKVRPLRFEDVNTEQGSFLGFYQNKHTEAVRAVFRTSSLTDEYGRITENCRLTGQDGNDYIPKNRLDNNWDKLTDEQAEKLWNNAVNELPEFRTSNLHLIGGTVLPVWDLLPSENVRIYRVLTSDGEMLIGRVIPEDMIDITLHKLGASRAKEDISTEDLIKGIKKGDTVHLENGWRVTQKRVSNEQRIELIGASYLLNDLLVKKGVFTERIGYQTRYFIPAEKDTVRIMDDVIKISPVNRVENKDYAAENSYPSYSSHTRVKAAAPNITQAPGKPSILAGVKVNQDLINNTARQAGTKDNALINR
jgi:tRNA G10  N-methylase Trm11